MKKSIVLFAFFVTIFGRFAYSDNSAQPQLVAAGLSGENLISAVQTAADGAFQRARRSEESAGREIVTIGHSRVIKCPESDACVAKHMSADLAAEFANYPNFSTKVINLISVKGGGITMFTLPHGTPETLLSHAAVLITIDGVKRVIDPVLTGTGDMVPYDTWLSLFSNAELPN